jgi:hypothetical protein
MHNSLLLLGIHLAAGSTPRASAAPRLLVCPRVARVVWPGRFREIKTFRSVHIAFRETSRGCDSRSGVALHLDSHPAPGVASSARPWIRHRGGSTAVRTARWARIQVSDEVAEERTPNVTPQRAGRDQPGEAWGRVRRGGDGISKSSCADCVRSRPQRRSGDEREH